MTEAGSGGKGETLGKGGGFRGEKGMDGETDDRDNPRGVGAG